MAQAQLDLQAAMAGSLPDGSFSSSPTMEPMLEESPMKEEKMEVDTVESICPPSTPISSVTNLGKRRERGKKKPSCPAECTQHDVCPTLPSTPQKPHVVFERFRRSRLSRTVAEIAKCVPLSNPKHDKATVLEAAVVYLEYFHENVGNTEQFDAEFLLHLNNGTFTDTTAEISKGTSSEETQSNSVSNIPETLESKVETPRPDEPADPPAFKVPEIPAVNANILCEKPKPKRKRPTAKTTVENRPVDDYNIEVSPGFPSVTAQTNPTKKPSRKRPAKKSKPLPADEANPVTEQRVSGTTSTDSMDKEASPPTNLTEVPVSTEAASSPSDRPPEDPMDSLPPVVSNEDLSLAQLSISTDVESAASFLSEPLAIRV